MWDLQTIIELNEKEETKKFTSYKTCECEKKAYKAYKDKEGKYLCPKCKKEVPSSCKGW